MKTVVVNKYRESFDVWIGRPSLFGNPFILKDERDRESVVAQYREYFVKKINSSSEFREAVWSLKGKRLACVCKPKKCHGDIIVAWIEAGGPYRENGVILYMKERV